MLLTLPTFAPEVPAIIEFAPAGERHLRLVLAMSQMGMIADDDLAGLRRTRMSASAIRVLIEKGWQRAVGDDYEFRLISAYARLILPNTSGDEEFTSADKEPLVGVAINADRPEWITVGRAFESIENEYPGLGRTALGFLDQVLVRFGCPHTPSGMMEMCQNIYWMGEDNEDLVIEEMGGEDADVPRRDVLFDGVPEWAFNGYAPELPRVEPDDFAAHAERLSDRPVGRLMSALLKLHQINSIQGVFLDTPEEENEYGEASYPNEPPVVIEWDEDGQFNQIIDDHHRYEDERGEYPPWVGCVMFRPDVAGIQESLPRIRHTGQVLRALDEALIAAKELHDELRNTRP